MITGTKGINGELGKKICVRWDEIIHATFKLKTMKINFTWFNRKNETNMTMLKFK